LWARDQLRGDEHRPAARSNQWATVMRRFWRGIAIFCVGGVLGTGLGVALGFFFFPYVFPPPPAMEQLSEADVAPLAARPPLPQAAGEAPAKAAPVAAGHFIHANRSDPVHWGKGRVSVYERTLFLESDFEVGPGPKFHVYLVPNAKVRKEEQVAKSMFVDLGRLRAFKGSQRYPIPEGVSLKDFQSVVIWCERFGVLISPADLEFQQAAN
jgi:hypothetical protein